MWPADPQVVVRCRLHGRQSREIGQVPRPQRPVALVWLSGMLLTATALAGCTQTGANHALPVASTQSRTAAQAISSSLPPTSPSPSPQARRSATPSPQPSKSAAPQVPQITSVGTYTRGVLVYFVLHYSDPGHDAEGFGFVGVNGSGWAEENHPFASPSYGIVGPGSIAYPFNEACGMPQHYDSYVEAWIYDTAGIRGIIHSSHFRISLLRNSDGRHDGKFSTIPQAKMNVS